MQLFDILPCNVLNLMETVMEFDKAFLYFVDNKDLHPVADTVNDDTESDEPSDCLYADIRVEEAVHSEAGCQHSEAADAPPVAEADTLEIKRADSKVDTLKQEPESEDERQRNHYRSRMENHYTAEDNLQQGREERGDLP